MLSGMWLPTRAGRAAIILGLMLTSCQENHSDTTSASTASSPDPVQTTSTTTVDDQRCSTAQSSPGQFEAESGQYAVYLTGLDVAQRRLSFDVIQFLGGDEATRAYHRDFPDEPGGPPPNDYYIVNESNQVREATVGEDVQVRLVRLREDSDAGHDPGTFEELPTYLAGYKPTDQPNLSYNPFWLTLQNSHVTGLCEQYIP